MNKSRVENFLASLEADGVLKEGQQTLVLQPDMDVVGGSNAVDCTNKTVDSCSGTNGSCTNFGSACKNGMNSKCLNEPLPIIGGPKDPIPVVGG